MDDIEADRLLAEYIQEWPILGAEQNDPPLPPEGYPRAQSAYEARAARQRSQGHITDHDRILSLEFDLKYLKDQLSKTLDKQLY